MLWHINMDKFPINFFDVFLPWFSNVFTDFNKYRCIWFRILIQVHFWVLHVYTSTCIYQIPNFSTPNAEFSFKPCVDISKSEMKFLWFCFRNRSNTTDKPHCWEGRPWVDPEGSTGPWGQTPGCCGYPGLPLSSASCAREKQKIWGETSYFTDLLVVHM